MFPIALRDPVALFPLFGVYDGFIPSADPLVSWGGDPVGDLSANRSPQGYYLSWLGYPGGGTYLDPWTSGGGDLFG